MFPQANLGSGGPSDGRSLQPLPLRPADRPWKHRTNRTRALAPEIRERQAVVLIGAGDLDTLIRCKDRSETLKEMHQRAVVPGFDRTDDKEASPQR